MQDKEILELYRRRDERAITETQRKYGAYCRKIALGLLGTREDADECVSDALHIAWERLGEREPVTLQAFLGRVTRNLAISRYRAGTAKKRGGGMDVLLSELGDCLPDYNTPELELERKELSRRIGEWLQTLQAEERALFVRRYWHGEGVKELARRRGCTPNQMAQRMLRLRRSLKEYLESKGVEL